MRVTRIVPGMLLLLVLSMGIAGATTYVVDDDWAGADFSSIQDAIDAATDGDRIHVNAGTYNEWLNVDKELTLNGNGTGPSGTIIDVSSSNAINVSAGNVSLRKLQLDGVGSAGSGVHMTGQDNISFEDGLSVGFENGIWANGCRWVRVQRSEFWNATDIGIAFGDCYSVLVQETLVNGTGGDGLRIDSTAWFGVLSSDLKSNWGSGVGMANSDNGTIQDSNISWNNRGAGWDDGGIYSVDTDNLSVERCEVHDNPKYGVITLRAWYCDLVDNNITYNCGGEAGVYLSSCDRFTMERNNISASTGVGLQVYLSNNCSFDNNTICDNGRTTGYEGIYLYDSHDNLFENNNISENPFNGVTVAAYCTNNVFRYNEIHGNDYAGISIPTYGTSTKKIVLWKNSISHNSRDGIAILGGDGLNTIARNTVTRNNVIADTTFAGIRIDGAGSNSIIGNTVSRNPRYGVRILNSTGQEVTGNQIVFNCGGEAGLFLDNVDNSTFHLNNITNSTGAGVEMYYSDGNEWTEDMFFSNDQLTWGFDGVFAESCTWNRWFDCEFQYNLNTGVRLVDCENLTFENCRFVKNSDDGLEVVSSSNVMVDGCDFIDNDYSGARLQSSDHCRVSNSTMSGNFNGIVLYQTSWSLVEANHVDGSMIDGICLEHYSTDNTVLRNNVTRNNRAMSDQRAGIRVDDSDWNLVRENVVEENGRIGITIRVSDNCTLTWNEVRKTDNGAGMELYSVSDVAVSWNNVSNNSASGIDMYFSSDVTVHNNTVNGNRENASANAAIYGYDVDRAVVADNVAISGRTGISGIFAVYCSNWTVARNEFGRNQHGILITSSDNMTVVDNSLYRSYQYGIIIQNSKWSVVAHNEIFNNSDYGAIIFWSNDISVYLNNFYSNGGSGSQGYDDSTDNTWDNGTHGNYWSDYTGPDDDGDGIGDWPYNLTGGAGAQDIFPLTNATWNDAPRKVPEFPLVAAAGAVLAAAVLVERRRRR